MRVQMLGKLYKCKVLHRALHILVWLHLHGLIVGVSILDIKKHGTISLPGLSHLMSKIHSLHVIGRQQFHHSALQGLRSTLSVQYESFTSPAQLQGGVA